MGRARARRAAPDVPHRRSIPESERRPAIYIRVVLNDGPARSDRSRYALETLLSTIGVPFEFAQGLNEGNTGGHERRACLVVGGESCPEIDELARETAVVVLPSPHVGDAEPETAEAGIRDAALDPKQFRVLEEPTRGGYLVRISGDLIGNSFALLARTEEYATRERDQHDRFQWANSKMEPRELAARPLVSESAQLLLTCLKESCVQARIPMVQKEAWPLGHLMAGCLTHDVDVVRRGKLPRGIAVRDVRGAVTSVVRRRWRLAASQVATIVRTAANDQDPYWSFDRISALETRHDYRSTYYFMAGHHHLEDGSYNLDSPPMAGLLRGLAGSGCEIGLHGSYASYTDPVLLQNLKSDLEQRVGQPITGHRNHFLRFRVPDSWKAQEAAGFSYDATLGYNDREGFRGGHAFPFHPYDLEAEKPLELTEIPLAIMDVGLSKYRGLRGNKALEAVMWTLEQTRSVNGLATLLWHNHTFCDLEVPGSAQLYQKALGWLAEKGAYVATAQEIDRWWRARGSVRLSPLSGGRTGWRLETPQEIAGLALRVHIPDPQAYLRVRGQVPLTVRREGPDYLLQFGLLPSGFAMDLEYA